MTRETIKTAERIAAGTLASLGALVLVEASATARDRKKVRSDKAEVVSNIRPGEYATFTVPGYHAEGHLLAKNMDRHFEEMGTTHYAVHPEKGFSLDSIREEWLKARALDGHRPARIYAMSMGGLLVSKLFSDEEFRREFGPVDKLVLDSALSGKKDLSVSEKLAMGLATVLPVTYTTNQIYHLVSRKEVNGPLDHAPEVPEEEVRERLGAAALIHFSAGRDQVLFMRREDVADMDLSDFGSEISRGVTYVASTSDRVLNTDRSVGVYSQSLEQDVEYRIDTLRKLNSSHAGGPEHPQGAVDALLDQHPERYHIRSIRYLLPKYSPNDPELQPAA